MMKKLLLAFMILSISITSFASSNSEAPKVSINGGGEIRHGNLFTTNPTFSSFKTEVENQLSKRTTVNFLNEEEADYVVNYKTRMLSVGFAYMNVKGIYSATVFNRKTAEEKSIKLKCGMVIHDGGNLTLKRRCAKKLAKKIIKLIK